MSKLYGTIVGQAKTKATRRGSSEIRASVQSWNGSIIMEMYYDDDDVLSLRVEKADGSKIKGECIWNGSFDKFVGMCRRSIRRRNG